MTSVKVKLRPSTVTGNPGTVVYKLSHKGEVRHLMTGLRLLPEQWDRVSQKIVGAAKDARLWNFQQRIDNDVQQLGRLISVFDEKKCNYSLQQLVDVFHISTSKVLFFEFMEELIAKLKAQGRYGTAGKYSRALNSFSNFLAGEKQDNLIFGMFTEEKVLAYNRWLVERGVIRNTISFYMRILRAVYNRAAAQGLVQQSFPFKNVYTGVDKTSNRAIDEKMIAKLCKLNLSDNPGLFFARDLFLFSYCTRGMAFVDIAYLRKDCVRSGSIRYERKKTGQTLIILIEPLVQQIIDCYSEQCADSLYIFPLIRSTDIEKAYLQYETALNTYNKRLKALSDILGDNVSLSSYTARHSWAKSAQQRSVPLSVISAGMGHTSERTTKIYLESLDNSILDKTNREIIGALNLSRL